MSAQISLYTRNLDNISLCDIEDFCSIGLPPEQRPKEGLRIDYKTAIPDDLAKDIAAMANTAGGLIFIGVYEDQGIPTRIVPIPLGPGDAKTRITNIALSCIDPPCTPEVGVCVTDTNSS